MNKINYNSEWIPFEEVVECFTSLENLLLALEEGKIRARAYFCSEAEPHIYEKLDIPSSSWNRCSFAKDFNGATSIPYTLEWDGEPVEGAMPILCWYKEIEVSREDIDKLGLKNTTIQKEKEKEKDIGGRPKKYEEKKFYADLAAMIYAGKIVKNDSNKWNVDKKIIEEIIFPLSPTLVSIDENSKDGQSISIKTVKNYVSSFFEAFAKAEKHIDGEDEYP